MEKTGLGHGHANAVTAIWLIPGNGGAAAAGTKAPAKSAVKKAVPVKKAAKKAPAKKK